MFYMHAGYIVFGKI